MARKKFNRDDYDMRAYDAALAKEEGRPPPADDPSAEGKPKGPPYEFANQLLRKRQRAKAEKERKQQEEGAPKKSKFNRDDYDMTDYDAALAKMEGRPPPEVDPKSKGKPKGPPFEFAEELAEERRQQAEKKKKERKQQEEKKHKQEKEDEEKGDI